MSSFIVTYVLISLREPGRGWHDTGSMSGYRLGPHGVIIAIKNCFGTGTYPLLSRREAPSIEARSADKRGAQRRVVIVL